MSVLAGVISRHGKPIPSAIRRMLREHISRNPQDVPEVFERPWAYLLKVDIGSFGDRGFRIDPRSRSVAMLAGEPLLACGDSTATRGSDLQALQHDLDARRTEVLSRATGVFALAHFHPATGRLTLATDKLGIHPLYCWYGEELIVFATAIRILEEVPEVPRTADLVGITELISIHLYAVGDRTQYAEVKRLRAAETVKVEAGTVQSDRYWDWRVLARPEKISADDAVARTHNRFMHAVRKRWRGNSPVPACLSGGLDSRSVVAALRTLGADVHAFNYYAFLDSQEQVFASQFAQAIGARYTAMELPMWQTGSTFENNISQAWRQELAREGRSPGADTTLWTGEGGSVALGHLLLTPEIVAHLRSGNYAKAFALHRYRKPPAVFKPDVWHELNEAMLADFRREIERANCDDPARGYHLFLMTNHQRSGLTPHFENIDVHRLDYQVPFFDSEVLASILPLPVDWCVRHKFYYKWLKMFPAAASTVPWQAYPGHEPCPLPISAGLSSQWCEQQLAFKSGLQRPKLVNEAKEILDSPKFPSSVFRKRQVQLALWLHSHGLRNCQFGLLMLSKFYRHWIKSDGGHVLDRGRDRTRARVAAMVPAAMILASSVLDTLDVFAA